MRLWLDDIRPAPKGWVWVKDARHFMSDLLLMFEDITEVSLDHDLGDGACDNCTTERESTGEGCFQRDCDCNCHKAPDGSAIATAIRALQLRIPKVTCHSQNKDGRERMVALLTDVCDEVHDEEFDPKKFVAQEATPTPKQKTKGKK